MEMYKSQLFLYMSRFYAFLIRGCGAYSLTMWYAENIAVFERSSANWILAVTAHVVRVSNLNKCIPLYTQANSGGVTQIRTRAQQKSQQMRQRARDAVLARKRKLSNTAGDGSQQSTSTFVSPQRGRGRGRGRGGKGRGGGTGLASRLSRGGGLISPSRLASEAK